MERGSRLHSICLRKTLSINNPNTNNKAMAEKPAGHILIECPNTIFHLYARDEGELSKIETFLRNIRGIKRLGLNDIYIWCNRQGILYVTKFHYRKDFSLWFNMKSYYLYFLQKFRYQFAQYAG